MEHLDYAIVTSLHVVVVVGDEFEPSAGFSMFLWILQTTAANCALVTSMAYWIFIAGLDTTGEHRTLTQAHSHSRTHSRNHTLTHAIALTQAHSHSPHVHTLILDLTRVLPLNAAFLNLV